MFSISVVLNGFTGGAFVLLYKEEEGWKHACEKIQTCEPDQKIIVQDDYQQTLDFFRHDVSAILYENMLESRNVTIERALNQTLTQLQLNEHAEKNPAIGRAMTRARLANPMGGPQPGFNGPMNS